MKTKMDYHREAVKKADELIREYQLDMDTRLDLLSVFKKMKVPMKIVPRIEFKFFSAEGVLEIPSYEFLNHPCNRVDVIFQWAERLAPKNVIPAWYYGIQMAFAYEFLIPFTELRAFLKERPMATPLDVSEYFKVPSLFAVQRLDLFEEEVSE